MTQVNLKVSKNSKLNIILLDSPCHQIRGKKKKKKLKYQPGDLKQIANQKFKINK